MTEPKKLIEVAMPIKEISAESVRDKSIRHGHISTLHIWWARRPLPVSRAVVFASLVSDPLDQNCPFQFKEAVEIILGKENNIGDPYHPYKDIPWTSVFDPMEDNLRNRLQMFIGKFTDEMQQHLLHNKSKPEPKNQLTDSSLIKWENKSNDIILNKARKLIYVSYNSLKSPEKSTKILLEEFENYFKNIAKCETDLYEHFDRHIETDEVAILTNNLTMAIDSFLDKMPKVFDPFAGGGAIPLEASRLGCKTYGNDINPVAHIIQKGSLEFPQKFGKPIQLSKKEFIRLYGTLIWQIMPNESLIYKNGEAIGITIQNRLSFDVNFYAKKILNETEKTIGHLYPTNNLGKKPIAFYWVRMAICSNPSCKVRVPMLKQFYLANTKSKKIYLNPIVTEGNIQFTIEIGSTTKQGWLNKNLTCPCCGSTTSTRELKEQAEKNLITEKLIAIIEESKAGKTYRLPTENEIMLSEIDNGLIDSLLIPNEQMKEIPDLVSGRGWGINKWSQMFSSHQLYTLQSLLVQFNKIKKSLTLTEYNKAIITYLAIWFDKICSAQTSFGRWNIGGEKIETPFSKQAIPMMFDFPEGNIFSGQTGSAKNQLDWVIRYINSESISPFSTTLNNASSGDKSQFDNKYITAVITDPPYYDAIAYADLSDFFYVWLKRTLSDVHPSNFATPNTPKTEECTALKHHHNNSKIEAKTHFEYKLTQIFDAIEHQTSDIVSIMFAHQSTEAWTTLCNSILEARMNITGSWAIDTEMANRSIGLAGAALESSVTVSCRPSQRNGNCDFSIIKKAVETTVESEVELLYGLGFRGADLLTACFGQAVSEFGKYEKIQKADGTLVSVSDLLELARVSAFNSLLKGFKGDDFTKFYIGWLQLNGFIEGDNDDAAKFTKVGLSIDVQDLYKENILIKSGNKQHLADLNERISKNNRLGETKNCSIIDVVHKMMYLYSSNNRSNLLKYIEHNSSDTESPNWRVLTSLVELLPKDIEDHKLAIGLLTNKELLIREAKSSSTPKPEQSKLILE